jgi:hypothetical protein
MQWHRCGIQWPECLSMLYNPCCFGNFGSWMQTQNTLSKCDTVADLQTSSGPQRQTRPTGALIQRRYYYEVAIAAT